MRTCLFIITLGGLLLALLTGCEYKSLDELTTRQQSVLLDFDWKKVGQKPKSFQVVFYPADETTANSLCNGYASYGVYNGQAILDYLPEGNYDVTAWSSDFEYNKVINIPRREEVAATMATWYGDKQIPVHVIDSLYGKQRIYATPDYMLKATVDNFSLQKDVERQPLVLTPDSAVVAIKIEVHGVKGLNLAKEIRGTLNNVAKERLLSYERESQDTATVMFNFNFSQKDSLIWADFYLFDIEPTRAPATKTESNEGYPHLLTIFFWLEGNNVFLPIDVTEEIRNYSSGIESKIVLSLNDIDIDLKDYQPNMGGFDVDINGWDDVEIEIPW